MFGPQASSLSRTGTNLLLLMVALVQLTCNTTLSLDDVKPKNRTTSLNLTDRGQSMLRHSFVTPAKSLGLPDWIPTGIPDAFTKYINFPNGSGGVTKCWMGMELRKCVTDNQPKFEATSPAKMACQSSAAVVSCQIEAACEHCTGEELEKAKSDFEGEIKGLEGICANYKSMIPSNSCTNWTLIIIIVIVVVLVILAIVVGVIVYCCCCKDGGGKGKGGGRGGISGRSRGKSTKSKSRSKRGSKSKSNKGSSKNTSATTRF